MEIQIRGQLTDRIKEKSLKLLGYEISETELRLMPYLQYVLVNSERLDRKKINHKEMDILDNWINKKLIVYNVYDDNPIKITKKFWNTICELIYLGYVDLNE